MFSEHPSVHPVFVLQDTGTGFLHVWLKHPLGLEDKLFTFCRSKVGHRTHTFVCNSTMHTIIMTTFHTNVLLD